MTQHISSLMDGELDTHASEQAIRDCGAPEGMQAWREYHLIGECLREGLTSRFDVSARVMGALEKETVVAVDFAGAARPRAKPGRVQSFGRIALAAAASVATIGVVGWIGTQGVPGTGASPTLASGGVTMQTNAPVANANHQAPAQEPTYAALEVNEYLAAHRQVPSPEQYRTVAARTPAAAR
jgi:sigma-E factor negative regulatory protein RseA